MMGNNQTKRPSIRGGGGGGKGGGGGRVAREDVDSLTSRATAKLIDALSEGEIDGFADPAHPLRCVALDGTPIANPDDSLNFKNFEFFFLPGSQEQSYIPGFNAAETIEAVGVRVRASTPWTHRFTNASIDAIRIDVRFPRLSKQNTQNGDITGTEVQLKIDIQANNGGFVTKINDTIRGKASNPYIRSYRLDLSGLDAPWDVRVTRLTADSTSQAIQNETYIESHSTVTYGKLRYPNTAVVGIKIDAEQFGNIPSRAYRVRGMIIDVPKNYDPITRVYATTGEGTTNGTWNGEFKQAWTNNPAWCYYAMATHPRFGLGNYMPASSVNKFALYAIAQYCDEMVSDGNGGEEPRFQCSLYLQKREDAMKVMSDMATIFRGMHYFSEGVLQPIQDRPRTPDIQFSPANVINGQFVYTGTGRRARHTAALVAYNDQNNFGQLTTEAYEDGDAILRYGYNPLQITNIGCPSRMTARRMAKWAITAEQILHDALSFQTGAEGFMARPGWVAAITNPFRSGADFSGRIAARTATTITLDRSVTLVSGKTYWIAVTTLQAGTWKPITVAVLNGPGPTNVITVASMAEMPDVETLWQLSNEDVEPELFRVLSVTPNDDATVTISCLQYNDSLYAHIDDAEELVEPPTSILPNPASVVPPGAVTLRASVVIEGNQARRDLFISWLASEQPDPSLPNYVAPDAFLRGYQVSYRPDDGNWERLPESPATDAVVRGILSGNYDVRVLAVNRYGNVSAPSIASLTVQVQSSDMPHATGLELDGQGADPVFQQRDAKFVWRLNSPTLTALQQLSSGGDQDPYFVAYEVSIIDPATDERVWRVVTTTPNYTHTYEKNVESMRPARPLSSFRCEVRVINTYNLPDNQPARLLVSNPAPGAPVNVAAIAAFRTIFLTWENGTEADLSVIEIWRNTVNDFATATHLKDVAWPANSATADGVAGTEYFFWLRAVDTFGSKSQETAAASVTPGSIVATDIDRFAVDASRMFTNTVVLQGDVWTNDTPDGDSISWNAHSLFYRGVEYLIAAGSSALKYITWIVPAPPAPGVTVVAGSYAASATAPAMTNSIFTIAANLSGSAIIVWRSIANAVIGSANIVNAAILNAHIANLAVDDAKIANLSVAKLIADTILASRFYLGAGGVIQSDDYAAGVTGFHLSRAMLEVQKLVSRDPIIIYGVATPSVSPGSQQFDTSLAIIKDTPSGTTARYTVDGSPVGRSSAAWPGGGTLTITASTFLRVRAYADTGLAFSDEFFAYYHLISGTAPTSQTATPSIRVMSGWPNHETVQLQFACATVGATFLYGKNGDPITTAWTSGNVPLLLDEYIDVQASESSSDSAIATYDNVDVGPN